jgi:hypothetical protein
MALWIFLWSLVIFFPRFDTLYQDKSGNPAVQLGREKKYKFFDFWGLSSRHRFTVRSQPVWPDVFVKKNHPNCSPTSFWSKLILNCFPWKNAAKKFGLPLQFSKICPKLTFTPVAQIRPIWSPWSQRRLIRRQHVAWHSYGLFASAARWFIFKPKIPLKFWSALCRLENVELFSGHLEYFTDIWDILQQFGTFCINLIHLIRFWYHVPRKIWQPRKKAVYKSNDFCVTSCNTNIALHEGTDDATQIGLLLISGDVARQKNRTF